MSYADTNLVSPSQDVNPIKEKAKSGFYKPRCQGDDGSKIYQCDICLCDFSKTKRYIWHRKICKKTLMTNLRTVSTKPKNAKARSDFLCQKCGESFATEVLHGVHIMYCKGKPSNSSSSSTNSTLEFFNCGICKITVATKQLFMKHHNACIEKHKRRRRKSASVEIEGVESVSKETVPVIAEPAPVKTSQQPGSSSGSVKSSTRPSPASTDLSHLSLKDVIILAIRSTPYNCSHVDELTRYVSQGWHRLHHTRNFCSPCNNHRTFSQSNGSNVTRHNTFKFILQNERLTLQDVLYKDHDTGVDYYTWTIINLQPSQKSLKKPDVITIDDSEPEVSSVPSEVSPESPDVEFLGEVQGSRNLRIEQATLPATKSVLWLLLEAESEANKIITSSVTDSDRSKADKDTALDVEVVIEEHHNITEKQFPADMDQQPKSSSAKQIPVEKSLEIDPKAKKLWLPHAEFYVKPTKEKEQAKEVKDEAEEAVQIERVPLHKKRETSNTNLPNGVTKLLTEESRSLRNRKNTRHIVKNVRRSTRLSKQS